MAADSRQVCASGFVAEMEHTAAPTYAWRIIIFEKLSLLSAMQIRPNDRIPPKLWKVETLNARLES
jgi:hypothetical protein